MPWQAGCSLRGADAGSRPGGRWGFACRGLFSLRGAVPGLAPAGDSLSLLVQRKEAKKAPSIRTSFRLDGIGRCATVGLAALAPEGARQKLLFRHRCSSARQRTGSPPRRALILGLVFRTSALRVRWISAFSSSFCRAPSGASGSIPAVAQRPIPSSLNEVRIPRCFLCLLSLHQQRK